MEDLHLNLINAAKKISKTKMPVTTESRKMRNAENKVSNEIASKVLQTMEKLDLSTLENDFKSVDGNEFESVDGSLPVTAREANSRPMTTMERKLNED